MPRSIENIVIIISKHFEINQISALNNLLRVDMLLNYQTKPNFLDELLS